MSDKPADRVLLDLWRDGDQDAARQIFDTYADRLLLLARRRISRRLAGRVDPEDVVQSVFRSFFHRCQEGRFKIEEQDDVSKLLVRITLHKTLRKVAFHKAAKRDPGQEVVKGDDPQAQLRDLLTREPTPEATITFLDQLEHFLQKLKPEERQILELRLQGCSNEEIVQKLKLKYDRKVRRVFEHIRSLAEQDGIAPEG